MGHRVRGHREHLTRANTTQSLGSSTSYMPAGVGGKAAGSSVHTHRHINTPAFIG